MVMIGMNQHIYHSWWPQMVTTRFQSTHHGTQCYIIILWLAMNGTLYIILVATDGNYTFLVYTSSTLSTHMVMIGMNRHIYHSWWPQMVTPRTLV